jgi:adenylate cyclase
MLDGDTLGQLGGRTMADIQTIFDWLVDGAPGAPSPSHMIARLGPDLVLAGVPIDRVESFVRTLHPHIVGRTFVWAPGRVIEVLENSYAYLQSPAFLHSPAAAVFRTGQALRRQLADPACPRDFTLLDDLRAEGFTDYLAAPITFISGQVHAITFATRRASGFSEAHVAALLRILQPLSRMAEIFALSRTAVTLLNTYVGRNAGERIMAGHIQRGDTDTLHAVIWFSDLRGFTALAGTMAPGALIHVLNDLFECQVSAIERHRGEVLKFMGDGLLAIFPIDAAESAPGALCDAALAAAQEAFAAVSALNEARSARGEGLIRLGLALHLGDVAYGNVGSAGRLDFTCIGEAVNFAARLEGLTSRLDRKVVLSEAFARVTTRPLTAAGTFELKGVAEPQPIFVPDGF